MKTIRTIVLFLSLLLLISACGRISQPSEIDYKNLSKTGNWEVIKKDSGATYGYIKVKEEIWLMHFLHWWPLNENNSEISVKYTKNLLMNLWGMQFTLTGVEGETQVNGHTAYYIEGTLGNFVKTRFIVWNCNETNRQFLSDCNINISLNTPEELLDLQISDITNSVCCHNQEKTINNPKISQSINYPDKNIVFDIPANWRSSFYIVNPNSDKNIPGYYKNGITEERGTIWNLLTDAEKEISFIWEKSNRELTVSNFKNAINSFFADTIISMKDTLEYRAVYANVNSQTLVEKNYYFENLGKFDVITDIVGYKAIDTTQYKYKAFFWKNKETEYLMVATMVAHNNIWGIPFNLAPTELQFEEFINEVVLKNINNHPVLRD